MITDWSVSNNIHVIIGKLEVVYVTDEYNITNVVLDMLKEKGEYVEEEDTVEYKGDLERQLKGEERQKVKIASLRTSLRSIQPSPSNYY